VATTNDEVDHAIRVIAQQCVAVRLRLVTRAVTNIYNRALRPHGLNVSQMNILVAVSCLNEAKQQDVCRVLHLDRSTLSRDIERLHAYGWLSRRTGVDGRTSLLRLTRRGTATLQKSIPAWEAAQAEAIKLLGKEHIAKLDRSAQVFRSISASR
jgi:DNA-binding MarR family transcriptional regulator